VTLAGILEKNLSRDENKQSNIRLPGAALPRVEAHD
jgi:hypothetical protein